MEEHSLAGRVYDHSLELVHNQTFVSDHDEVTGESEVLVKVKGPTCVDVYICVYLPWYAWDSGYLPWGDDEKVSR